MKHNENHHTFTNVEGMDDDIDIKPWVRVHEGQKRIGSIVSSTSTAFCLYGLTYLFWVFFNDMKKYFTGKIADNTMMKPMKLKEHIIFWVTKIGYVAVFIVLPMFFAGVVPTWSVMVSWSSSPVSSSLWCSNWRTWWRRPNSCIHPPMVITSKPNGPSIR
jgi:fatty acid desaturase